MPRWTPYIAHTLFVAAQIFLQKKILSVSFANKIVQYDFFCKESVYRTDHLFVNDWKKTGPFACKKGRSSCLQMVWTSQSSKELNCTTQRSRLPLYLKTGVLPYQKDTPEYRNSVSVQYGLVCCEQLEDAHQRIGACTHDHIWAGWPSGGRKGILAQEHSQSACHSLLNAPPSIQASIQAHAC